MSEEGINHPRQLDSIESGRIERAKQPEADGVVSVIGVRTSVGILVAVNGCTIGLAEDDDSEKYPDEAIEKTVDDISRLKELILSQSKGDTQKIALYLLAEVAEHGGKKIKAFLLAQHFGIDKTTVHFILLTLCRRAISNDWPLLISYCQNNGANFVTRKKSFGPR